MKKQGNELRRNQIMKAGIKLFSEKGFHTTYVDEIIKEAVVGKGTFYRNYKNKEELFIALLLQFLMDWRKAVMIDITSEQITDYDAYFTRIARESFLFFQKNPDLANLYFRIAPGLSDIIEPHIRSFEKQMLDFLILDIEAARKLGYLPRTIHPVITANIIAGAFFRVHYYYFILNRDEQAYVSIDTLVHDFKSTILHGIMSGPPA